MTLNIRRQALGLTFAAVADSAGLSLRSVFRLMAANALPKSRCAQEQLASALKVDLAGLSALVAVKTTRRGALVGGRRGRGAQRAHASGSTARGGK